MDNKNSDHDMLTLFMSYSDSHSLHIVIVLTLMILTSRVARVVALSGRIVGLMWVSLALVVQMSRARVAASMEKRWSSSTSGQYSLMNSARRRRYSMLWPVLPLQMAIWAAISVGVAGPRYGVVRGGDVDQGKQRPLALLSGSELHHLGGVAPQHSLSHIQVLQRLLHLGVSDLVGYPPSASLQREEEVDVRLGQDFNFKFCLSTWWTMPVSIYFATYSTGLIRGRQDQIKCEL